MSKQPSRIGVDIGGTFTDLIYQDEEGVTTAVKTPTVPAHPDQGCMDAIHKANIKNIAQVSYFLHATTVGLNALLERRGVTVGILTTQGFRDTLVIGRGDRAEMYNIKWNPPKPIVPRKLRLEVRERILSDGSIRTPLNNSDVKKAVTFFQAHKVDAIAVIYLHAYANPIHELETLKMIQEQGFGGQISLSHQVTGEYREYERTTTTAIDAFVSGRMGNYLQQLTEKLQEVGFQGVPLITKSGGGAMTFKEANGSLVQTIMSGPVAGAEGAAELSRVLKLGDLITADVGGTSFDTCIIRQGRPQLMYQGEMMGMPVLMPWVDVRSIGAGGGSIAYTDDGGLLRVGPKSAGAHPGPACYGRGGTLPTITDAAFILGMMGKGKLASELTLDEQKSRQALQPLSDTLGIAIEEVAKGVLQIATSSMANTIKEITVENGIDPREMKLIAYGGAGPLFAHLIATDLQIKTIVIPPFAGNFSAWGLLGTDILYTKSWTKKIPLQEGYQNMLNPILKDLFDDLKSRLKEDIHIVYEVSLDIRYQGQEHALTLPMKNKEGHVLERMDAVKLQFQKAYSEIYDTNLDAELEIVSIRGALRKSLAERQIQPLRQAISAVKETRSVYSFNEKKRINFQLIDKKTLAVGKRVEGPIILTEDTSTAYIDTHATLQLDASGCVMITQS